MIWLALAGAVFLIWFVLVFLFTPAIGYHARTRVSLDAPGFLRMLQSTCQAMLHEGNQIEVLTNGQRFYPAMLDAIKAAAHTINYECYIFNSGRTTARLFISCETMPSAASRFSDETASTRTLPEAMNGLTLPGLVAAAST